MLIPNHFLTLAFISLVLYITGIIGTAIQLNVVIDACKRYVDNDSTNGVSTNTLIWLNQHATCENWVKFLNLMYIEQQLTRGEQYVSFAFYVSGTVLLIWIMFVARGVADGDSDRDR